MIKQVFVIAGLSAKIAAKSTAQVAKRGVDKVRAGQAARNEKLDTVVENLRSKSSSEPRIAVDSDING